MFADPDNEAVRTWVQAQVAREVDRNLVAIRDIAETATHEINWQDGDIAILDNTRVMHGRRAIADANRNLFIGMGMI